MKLKHLLGYWDPDQRGHSVLSYTIAVCLCKWSYLASSPRPGGMAESTIFKNTSSLEAFSWVHIPRSLLLPFGWLGGRQSGCAPFQGSGWQPLDSHFLDRAIGMLPIGLSWHTPRRTAAGAALPHLSDHCPRVFINLALLFEIQVGVMAKNAFYQLYLLCWCSLLLNSSVLAVLVHIFCKSAVRLP